MQHPIKQFLDTLFPDKLPQKRAKWSQYFIDQQYDNIDDLRKISEDDWVEISKQIPQKIVSDIKQKLANDVNASLTSAEKIKLCQLMNMEMKHQDIVQFMGARVGTPIGDAIMQQIRSLIKLPKPLSAEEKIKLCQLMNMEMKHQDIVQFMGAKVGTPKGDAIMQQIRSLIKPPKPLPAGAKAVKARVQEESLPLFLYKGKELTMAHYYTLLVIGETGSGKTTLLDAFVNKLTGMEFTDNWRWKLVNEDHLLHVDGKQSQTSNITTYYVNDKDNRFNIRIIDTPGFGDTKGIKADDLTVNKFQQLFSEIPEIDYILLTVKASETRLKPGSKYIYDRVQQIFGVDAKDRFILMCTFADGNKPLCLTTFANQNLTYHKYFTFNNSHLYTPSVNSNTTTKFYWKMAMSSVQQFANFVISQDRRPLSLKQSKEVLQARRYLEESIKTSQKSFTAAFTQLDVAKRNLKQLSQNKKQIEEHGEYTKTSLQPKYTYTDLGKTVQMCNTCKVTCCQICIWPPGQTYSACTYFNSGNCPKCPGKCSRYDHVRTNDFIKMEMVPVTQVVSWKKKAYEKGLSGFQNYKAILKQNKAAIEQHVQTIWKHGNEIKSNLSKLKEIALQPKMFTDEDFYNQMIEEEKQRKIDGYTERVQYLQETLERMKICQKMSKVNTIEDLFPEYKDLVNDYEVGTSSTEKSKLSCEIY